MLPRSILVVDDDPGSLVYMALALEQAGYRVTARHGAREALAAMERDLPAVVVSDLQMPEMGGLELLLTIKRRWPAVPVLLATVEQDVAMIVEAVQGGATNYLVKPFSPHVLQTAVGKALARSGSEEAPVVGDSAELMPELIGTGEAIQRVRRLIVQASSSDVNVVITGQTGTGKGLVAQTLHHLYAPSAPFVDHNCARVELFDSEFFGHRRGAFTGADRHRTGLLEEANGGVLFLDEMECLSLANQAKLLKVLDDGEVRPLGAEHANAVNVRFFAATNREPRELIQRRELREDFYYRLRGFEIRLPPLQARPEDLPALVAHFLRDTGKTPSRQAMLALAGHHWPGNVRELRSVLRAACARASGIAIDPQHLGFGDDGDSWGRHTEPVLRRTATTARNESGGGLPPEPVQLSLKETTRRKIIRVLRIHQGKKGQAAQALGIHRSTLRRKLREFGIDWPKEGDTEQKGESEPEGHALAKDEVDPRGVRSQLRLPKRDGGA